MNFEIFVGTYTHKDSKSKGIYRFSFDANTGASTLVETIPAENPSFIRLYKNNLYTTHELGESNGMLSVFQLNEAKGTYDKVQTVKAYGNHPCHIMISEVNQMLFASNYSSGSLSVHSLDKDGIISGLIAQKTYGGSGPNKKRQTGPHVHSAFLNHKEDQLFVQDLGTDRSYVYKIKAQNIVQAGYISLPPGTGPRHLSISADDRYLYVLLELTAEIAVFKNGPSFELKQIISINRPGFKDYDCAAEIRIAPDGNFLYASNRGDANLITSYVIDPKKGTLQVNSHDDVKGLGPRNFNFTPDGNYIFIANQNSDEIVIFKRDKGSGKLTDSGFKISVPQPVCILIR